MHWQTPALHAWPCAHMTPQPPQLAAFVVVSVHNPAQLVWPSAQPGMPALPDSATVPALPDALPPDGAPPVVAPLTPALPDTPPEAPVPLEPGGVSPQASGVSRSPRRNAI
jgi:hypothetical protein